jgi:fructose-1,6-bisphosphatase I
MAAYATLREHLTGWSGQDTLRHAAADTILHLADAGIEIARIIAQGPLAGEMAAHRTGQGSGDTQKELDFVANAIVTDALKKSPVAWLGSEEDEEAQALNAGAPLAVNVDPLDGSSNIDTNVSIGTIFSILPAAGPSPLLQPGRNQLAAGYIIYGPQTALVLTLGEGTHIFWLAPGTNDFLLARPNIQIPPVKREYAVNASNFRYWDDAMKAYITGCMLGLDGPCKTDFNMRWIGSLVADAFRILTRGGIFLYPGDSRKGYTKGRLRLLYEASPIAMIVEQAGGACITGTERVLDIVPASLHQRVPLIFGSKSEVEEADHCYREGRTAANGSALFSPRPS